MRYAMIGKLSDLEERIGAGCQNRLIIGMSASGKTTLVKEEIKSFLNEKKGRICVFSFCAGEYEELEGKKCRVYPLEHLRDWLNKIDEKKARKIERIYIDEASEISETVICDDKQCMADLFELAAKYQIAVTVIYQKYNSVPEQIKANAETLLVLLPYTPRDIAVLSGKENESISDPKYYSNSVLLAWPEGNSMQKVILSLL